MLDARQNGRIPIADVERVLAVATEMYEMEQVAVRSGSPQRPHLPPGSASSAKPSSTHRRGSHRADGANGTAEAAAAAVGSGRSSPLPSWQSNQPRAPRHRSPSRALAALRKLGGGSQRSPESGTRMFKDTRFDRFSGFGGIRTCRELRRTANSSL